MTRHKRSIGELMDHSFAPFRNLPVEHEDSVGERVLQRLQSEPEWGSEAIGTDIVTVRRARRQTWFAVAAVTAVIVVLASVAIVRNGSWQSGAHVADIGNGALYRVDGTQTNVLHAGEGIGFGETVRSDGDVAATLILEDGSQVEMRPKSKLMLERAEDGVRIHLNAGGVIVNAAKQRTGHLYVQTRDLMVSVVGTVFLVNAEEEGSRVAVFEGEVRVRQGKTETKLRSGEQVATNPAIEPLPMAQEVSWSREAEVLMALLQQAAAPAPSQTRAAAAPPNPAGERLAFDVVSIRPIEPVRYGTCQTRAGQVQIDPGRMVLRGVNTYWLFLVAYQEKGAKFCDYPETWKFLAENGKPNWFESFSFDVEATIPKGYVNFTGSQVAASENLQLMIRALLEDRFKLKMHQITQVVDGYVLKPDKDREATMKLTPWNNDIEIDPNRIGGVSHARITQDTKTGETVYETLLWRWSMKEHISSLVDDLEKPILDESGITYEFNFITRSSCPSLGVLFMQTGQAVRTTPCENTLNGGEGPLYKRLGLKLEPAKIPVKTWVIDHIEKPSAN